MSIYNLLRANGSIVVNKKLAKCIGLHEAILYSEIISRHIYFMEREQLTEDGYFFNTIEDLQEATTLTEKQQRPAIKKLCDLKLIGYKVKGLPAKRYFRVNSDENVIINILASQQNEQLRQKVRTGTDKMAELETPKGQGNNTNINNTNIISYKDKGFYKKINTSELISDTVIAYYMDRYKSIIGKAHPVLNDNNLNGVRQKIDQYVYDRCIEYEDFRIMIDKYFDTDFDCDRNINHFLSETILENRFYEVLY